MNLGCACYINIYTKCMKDSTKKLHIKNIQKIPAEKLNWLILFHNQSIFVLLHESNKNCNRKEGCFECFFVCLFLSFFFFVTWLKVNGNSWNCFKNDLKFICISRKTHVTFFQKTSNFPLKNTHYFVGYIDWRTQSQINVINQLTSFVSSQTMNKSMFDQILTYIFTC